MSGWLGMRVQAEQRYRASMPERGVHNTAANAHFRRQEDGVTVFYPQGLYGRRGFSIPSAEYELLLRRNVREYRAALLVFYFFLSVAFGRFFRRMDFWQYVLWFVGVGAFDWIAAKLYFRKFSRTMDPADVANSPVAHWRSMGQTVHPILLLLEIVMLVFFSGAALYVSVKSAEPMMVLFSVMLAAGLIPFAIALRSWWEARHES